MTHTEKPILSKETANAIKEYPKFMYILNNLHEEFKKLLGDTYHDYNNGVSETPFDTYTAWLEKMLNEKARQDLSLHLTLQYTEVLVNYDVNFAKSLIESQSDNQSTK